MMDEDTESLHRRAWHAIPWVVNGTASREDRALVLEHAATCADCRDELALQRDVQAAMDDEDALPWQGPPHAHDPGPALDQLWARIDQEDAQAQVQAVSASQSGRWARWLAAVVVVQAVGLTALIGLQWQQRSVAAPYLTLSQAPIRPGPATIRLVPSPEMRQATLQALLKAHGLRIVEVNEDGGIFGLAGGELAVEDTVARLRAEAGVLLAEPVGAAAPPLAPSAVGAR